MKILLLGEFSNLHWTLAEGLRKLGHEVCVVSNGDRWRNYQRDISLTRQSDSILDGIQYVLTSCSSSIKRIRCGAINQSMFPTSKSSKMFVYLPIPA